MTEQVIEAGANADLANALIAGALENTSAPAQPVEEPKITPPPDREVELMVGVVNLLEGSSATDAVVRELNGADEEALTSPTFARSVSKYLAAVVERGTETIGGKKPTRKELEGLLIGDRELLLLGIRKATYGHEVELVTRCPHCSDVDNDYVLDLNDIEVKRPEDRTEAIYGFRVELPSGHTAHVNMSRAGDQDAVLQAGDKSEGELNTLMLSRCVQKIDDELVMSDNQLRAMGIRDRQAILKAINERTFGPRLGEAKRTCRACEKEFDLNLGLLDIFRA